MRISDNTILWQRINIVQFFLTHSCCSGFFSTMKMQCFDGKQHLNSSKVNNYQIFSKIWYVFYAISEVVQLATSFIKEKNIQKLKLYH